MQIVGEGPWAAAKHGTQRTRDWRKLHIGVDGRGFIVAHRLTESRADDASVVGELLSQFSNQVERFTAVESVREFGRREWKKRRRYYQQARVENSFYRYKQLIGGRLRSRNVAAQDTETGVAINVLNRMLALGASRSEPIRN